MRFWLDAVARMVIMASQKQNQSGHYCDDVPCPAVLSLYLPFAAPSSLKLITAMTQAPAQTPIDIPLLQELAARDCLVTKKPASYNLAELLGAQIDLADSIALAQALTALDRDKHSASASMEAAQKQLLNARGGMIRFVLRSFGAADEALAGKAAPFELPPATQATLGEPKEAIKLYRRFYSLHQSEMEHRVSRLRTSLRASMTFEGPDFIKLGNLDRILEDTLRDYVRTVLGGMSAALTKTYQQRRQEFLSSDLAEQQTEAEAWLQEGGWLYEFHRDIQQLLIAEIDFRLLPVRALLDALESQE